MRRPDVENAGTRGSDRASRRRRSPSSAANRAGTLPPTLGAPLLAPSAYLGAHRVTKYELSHEERRRYTSPMPPRPTGTRTSYRPSRAPAVSVRSPTSGSARRLSAFTFIGSGLVAVDNACGQGRRSGSTLYQAGLYGFVASNVANGKRANTTDLAEGPVMADTPIETTIALLDRVKTGDAPSDPCRHCGGGLGGGFPSGRGAWTTRTTSCRTPCSRRCRACPLSKRATRVRCSRFFARRWQIASSTRSARRRDGRA
jgi:hypothetical protein